MEDEKRKKKNKKKKKNKQQSKVTTDDNASNAGETSSGEQNQLNCTSVEPNGGIGDRSAIEVEGSDHIVRDANGTSTAQIGKENWAQEEVRLREMVRQLLYEKNSYIERQADLEMKIKQLMCDSDSWQEKKVSMEQRISKLLQEKASLSLEERNLQGKINHVEKERAVLVEKENSSKEVIATLSDENRRLQMQVLELEGAKTNLSQENRNMVDSILALQSRIKDLEGSLASADASVDTEKGVAENDAVHAEIEAAYALIEKLMTENADTVEKLTELYMELGSRSVAVEVTSTGIPDYPTVHHPVSESNEDISSSAKSIKIFDITIEDERVVNDIDLDCARHSSETAVSGEIVQISLDENEAQDLEAQTSFNEGDEAVPLIDAPIIGAPFRLISFVAKYVSGVDLVTQGDSQSPQPS